MKMKLIFIAMLTVLLTLGFFSCQEVKEDKEDKTPSVALSDDGDNGVEKTLVIVNEDKTGNNTEGETDGEDEIKIDVESDNTDSLVGDVLIALCSDVNDLAGSIVAYSGVKFTKFPLTIPLFSYKRQGESYTGTGSFYIILMFEGPTKDDSDDINYAYTAGTLGVVKYKLTQATTTIDFSQFTKLEKKDSNLSRSFFPLD